MQNRFFDERRITSTSHGVVIAWESIKDNRDGARPETVIEMVLERVMQLQEILPCEENEKIIHHLCEAISWEELRNRRRIQQDVQGTLQEHKSEDL